MIIGFDGSRINVSQRTGTENYSYEVLKHLMAIDKSNSYRIYSRSKLENPEYFTQNAQEVVINMPRLWTQVGLSLEIFKHKPDLLFVPAHTLPVVRPRGLKTVVTIHDLGAEYLPQYHQFPGKLYLNRSTEFAARHANHLIAVSDFTKKDLVNKMNVPEQKISVVHLGVDLTTITRPSPEQIKKVKEKYALSQEYILFVGTIQPRKNLVRLIEAFAKVLPKNVDLVLAGGKGWLSDEIYDAPRRLKIQDRVKFVGYIEEDDKPALYAGASLTALVSLFEGFGLPAIESMACGTPVIAANASSLPEVVGAAAILVDPLNVDQIAKGIHEGLTNTKLRQQLEINGYAQIAKFNWDDTARKTLNVFEKVMQEND